VVSNSNRIHLQGPSLKRNEVAREDTEKIVIIQRDTALLKAHAELT